MSLYLQLNPETELVTMRDEGDAYVVTLKNTTNGAVISFRVHQSDSYSTQETAQFTAELCQFVLTDPLLHAGVNDVRVEAKDGRVVSAHVMFHNHHIDALPFFRDASLDTRSVLIAILQACRSSTGSEVCAITFEPVPAGSTVVALRGEPQYKYSEDAIRRWVRERHTSPFTRAPMTDADIVVVQRVAEAVPLHQQPRLASAGETKQGGTRHIVVAHDISQSMQSMCGSDVRGLEDFLMQKRAAAECDTRVTIVPFNHKIGEFCVNENIKTLQLPFDDAQREKLTPDGSTAMHDAIAYAGAKLLDAMQPGDSGLFVVLTDGYDNRSTKTPEDTRRMLEQLKARGIAAVFLAANIGDAQEAGAAFGFSSDASLTFGPETAGVAFSMLRQATQGDVAPMFTPHQRELSAPVSAYTGPTVQSAPPMMQRSLTGI